jgi:uncharacterized SAM-binding protein YcdF (DUF218 family)
MLEIRSPRSEAPTTDHRPPTTDHRPPTTDHRPPTTDHRPPTSDLRPPTTDLRPPTSIEAIKSIIAWAISPLVIALIFQSLAWCLWRMKRRKPAVILLAAGFTVLLIGSLPVLSFGANRNREFVYRPLDPAKDLDSARPVLAFVLGTGFNPDPWLPPNSRVSGTFLARLLEGVRICHARPDARLLVSVANKDADPMDKRLFLAAMTEILSLDPARVELVTEAESTDDEARLVTPHLKDGRQLVLVTSASHMPRAMKIFSNGSMQPAAAPTDFHYPRDGSAEDKPWERWIPSSNGIGSTHQWLYETLASFAR